MRLILPLLAACSSPVEVTGRCDAPTSWADDTVGVDLGTCGGIALEPRVLGEGDLSVRFDAVAGGWQPVLEGTGTFEGLVLEGPWDLDGAAPVRLWRQGYQSWSWSGVEDLVALDLDEDGVPEPGGDTDGTSPAFEVPGTSWWVGLVGRDRGRSLLVGALSARTTRFFVAFDDSRAWVVWGHRGERVAVDGELPLDPFRIDLGGDPEGLLEDYADAVAVDPRRLDSPPPTGWATWYQYYSAVSEDDVRDNLAVAAALPDDLAPLEVFQVDDGWEQRWGDWTANERFPSGMQALAGDIAAAGFTPGLWMAPFYVHRDSEVATEHPDWWVRGDDGEPIVYTNLGSGDYVIIDVTEPEAGAWMARQVADRVAEGWIYLKLDFLYAGAQEGQRHEDVTGMQAYERGMALLREAAGDSWILACGAPLLPTVGWVEQFRTGADIAFEIDPDPRQDYLRWAARSTAARAWTNGRWWWVDPDQVLLRDPVTDVQATGTVVAQAVSGGAWLLGDDLSGLSSERLALALDPEVVALRGTAAHPEDPLAWPSGQDASPTAEHSNPDDQVPQRWRFSDGTVALLNLSEDTVTIDGPGGIELLSGATADSGPRSLAPGAGELWNRP